MAISTARSSTSRRNSSSAKYGSRKAPKLRKPRRRRRIRADRDSRRNKSSKGEKGRLKRSLESAKQKKAERKIRRGYQVLKDKVFGLMSKKEIDEKGCETGFAKRDAQVIEPFEFVLSSVLASTIEAKRGFASVWRVFGAATGQKTARSAITQRFGKGSADLMQAVFEQTLERLPEEESPPELSGKLQ